MSSAVPESSRVDTRRAAGLFCGGLCAWALLSIVDESAWATSNPDVWPAILFVVILTTGIVAGLIGRRAIDLVALPAGAALAIASGSLYFHGAADVWRADVITTLVIVTVGTTVVGSITYGLRRWTGRTREQGSNSGLLDYYTGTLFRTDGLGHSVFRPNGNIGSGYLVDTPDRELRLRRFFRTYLVVSFGAVVGLATLATLLSTDQLALFAVFAVFLVLDIGAYEIGVRRLVVGMPRSSAGRSSFRERLREQAVAFGRRRVAAFEATSVALVAMGLLCVLAAPQVWWVGVLGVAFFGAGTVMFAWELRALDVRPVAIVGFDIGVAAVTLCLVAAWSLTIQPDSARVPLAVVPGSTTTLSSGWVSYTASDGVFSVAFPGQPYEKRTLVNQPDQTGYTDHEVSWVTTDRTTGYWLNVHEYPAGTLTDVNETAAFDTTQAAIVAAANAKLVNLRNIVLNGHPAREFTMVSGDMTTVVRMCIVGDRAYYMDVMTTSTQPNEADITRFLDSFTLLPE